MLISKILFYVGVLIIFQCVFLATKQLYDCKLQHVYYGFMMMPGAILMAISFLLEHETPTFLEAIHLEKIVYPAALVIGLSAYLCLLLSYYREHSKKVLISFINIALLVLGGIVGAKVGSKGYIVVICFVLIQFWDIGLWVRNYNNRVENGKEG